MNPVSYMFTFQIDPPLQEFIVDPMEFQSRVTLANENLKTWSFLSLTSTPFCYEPKSYTKLELDIILDRRNSFKEVYRPEFFSIAFRVAFFFQRTEILGWIFENSDRRVQQNMIEDLLNAQGFDFTAFDIGNKPQFQHKIYAARGEIEAFQRSCFKDQVDILITQLANQKKFCNLWNCAGVEVRSCIFEDGNSWIQTAMIQKRTLIVRHLVLNGTVKFYNFLNGQTALETAQFYLSGNELLDVMSTKDENFTNQMMTCRTMGHRIKMIFAKPFSSEQQMAKCSWAQLVNSLIASIKNFHRFNSVLDCQNEIEASLWTATRTPLHKYEDESLSDLERYWTVIQSSWSGLFAGYIFRVNYIDCKRKYEARQGSLVKIDTTAEGFSRLRFYRFDDCRLNNLRSSLDTILFHSNNSLPEELRSSFFEKGIDQSLKLQPLGEVLAHNEENCAWVTLKTTFLALLILHTLKKEDKPIDASTLISAFTVVKPLFEMWEEEDFLQNMNVLAELLNQTTFFDRKAIFEKLSIQCIKRGYIRPIFKLTDWGITFVNAKDENGKTLIRYAYEKKLMGLFLHLYRNADLSLKDVAGKNLRDDIQKDPFFLKVILETDHDHPLYKKDIISLSKFLPSEALKNEHL